MPRITTQFGRKLSGNGTCTEKAPVKSLFVFTSQEKKETFCEYNIFFHWRPVLIQDIMTKLSLPVKSWILFRDGKTNSSAISLYETFGRRVPGENEKYSQWITRDYIKPHYFFTAIICRSKSVLSFVPHYYDDADICTWIFGDTIDSRGLKLFLFNALF